MKELIITDNHTKEIILSAGNVIEWQIYKVDGHWILGITYFDEDIEQDIRDAMTLCDATSDKWKDDLTAQWFEQ